MIVNEDKIMDKINKNLKIIDNLLMENGFYKYISKVVNIEDGISELYDDYKLLQQENARLKDKFKDLEEWLEAMASMYENEYKDVNASEHYKCMLHKLKEK